METTTAKRISLKTVAADNGFDDVNELLEAFGSESVMPACCSEGCEVEPDGHCEHGHPSLLMALGAI